MTEPTDQPADGARWRGYSHKELYLMLHDGPGAAASAEPSRRWAAISSTLTEIGQDLQKALDATNVAWSGRAAGAAYDRLVTTVGWAAETGESAAVMRTSVEDQGDHIAKARADMPKPEDVPAANPDPTTAAAVQVVQAQTDLEPAEATASSAAERAVEVMAAYEVNTDTTAAALASFVTPKELLPQEDIHHHRGGGLLGILPTVAAGLLGIQPQDNDRHDNNRGHGRGWNSPSTSGSSAGWDGPRREMGPAASAPGKMSGVAMEPMLSPGVSSRSQERSSSARGSGNGNGNAPGGGNTPGAGPKSGAAGLPTTTHELQQAAAASQAAVNPATTGAPMAPGAGAPIGGSHDKMALRRFGMEAIGSSQWFADGDEPVVGQSSKRRFDLRDTGDVTESVSILDEEHKLPPTVIGDGPAR